MMTDIDRDRKAEILVLTLDGKLHCLGSTDLINVVRAKSMYTSEYSDRASQFCGIRRGELRLHPLRCEVGATELNSGSAQGLTCKTA